MDNAEQSSDCAEPIAFPKPIPLSTVQYVQAVHVVHVEYHSPKLGSLAFRLAFFNKKGYLCS